MRLWSLPQSHSVLPQQTGAIFLLILPHERALTADVTLRRAGWTTMLAEEQLMFYGCSAGRDYDWVSAVKQLDLVRTRESPNVQELLEVISSERIDRASSEGLFRLLEALFELTGRKQFRQIEWLFQNAHPERLAPELSVGILRATSQYVRSIPSWEHYLDRTRTELQRRGIDSEQVLVGLHARSQALAQRS
jgi:hypothetical protein